MKRLMRSIGMLCLSALLGHPAGNLWAAELVAVSADVIEIGDNVQKETGLAWNELLEFGEVSVPGIIKVGEIQRKTALSSTLRLLQSEGKAQLLANPKILVKSGSPGAQFRVGGEIPYPVVNAQQVSTEFKKFGVVLNVAATILEEKEKKDMVNVHVQVSVSAPDEALSVQVGNTKVPGMTAREMETEVELKNGDTLVIGGLKQSRKGVSKKRVPFLGRIPLLGLLFTSTIVNETRTNLFLFLTLEIVK